LQSHTNSHVPFFHVGITVIDIDEARDFFHTVFKLEVVSERELTGAYLGNMLGDSSIQSARIAMLKLSEDSLLELVSYDKLNVQSDLHSSNGEITKIGQVHLAFFVEDLLEFEREHSDVLLSNFADEYEIIPRGPLEGSKIKFFHSKFGCILELIEKKSN
jgi:catechol 2,3-dioxygenase-like lactoylglutathione lyase family enzyme